MPYGTDLMFGDPFATNPNLGTTKGFDLQLPNPNLAANMPAPPEMPASNPALGPMNIASLLAMLGKSAAPPKYSKDREGRITKIPTWQETLSDSVGQMARWQLMAKALAAPGATGGAAGMNPMAMMMLMQNPMMGGGK